MRGGLLRHIGGGGGILRGGESLRGGGRTRWVRTAEAVISWPSIWPENQNHLKLRIIEQERKVTESKLSREERLSNSEKPNKKQNEWLKQSLRHQTGTENGCWRPVRKVRKSRR